MIEQLKRARDYWKTYAEALERALRKHCASCARYETGQRYCDTYNQHMDGCNNWQFDVERFAGEDVK
jgi:hypothetical protein